MHKCSSEEIADVIKLGFKLRASITKTPQEFINNNFSGLELISFLTKIEGALGHISNTVLNKYVGQYDGPPPQLTIRYYSDNFKDQKLGLLFSRTFVKESDGLIVYHDYLVLPEISRGKTIGKRVLAICLEQYLHMEVSKIKVHAGLEDGGYVWARVGFKAINKVQIDLILNVAEKRLKPDEYQIVKAWYDYYNNNPLGVAFNIEDWARLGFMEQMLKGSDWHGEIDLTNEFELSNFKNYVSGQ